MLARLGGVFAPIVPKVGPLGKWASQRELGNGSLVRLLTDWKTADIPVHAYFPLGSATRAAARALVDHLAAQLDHDPIHVRRT